MLEDYETALATEGQQRRRFCSFGKWVRDLDPEDRRRAEELVTGSRYNCRELARYFRSKGAVVNDQVLVRHRNGRCCGQRAAA